VPTREASSGRAPPRRRRSTRSRSGPRARRRMSSRLGHARWDRRTARTSEPYQRSPGEDTLNAVAAPESGAGRFGFGRDRRASTTRREPNDNQPRRNVCGWRRFRPSFAIAASRDASASRVKSRNRSSWTCHAVYSCMCVASLRRGGVGFHHAQIVPRVTITYCGSPIPRHDTRSFQSLKRPAGFDFQIHTWIW
jgi:hypothetical protein